MEDEGPGLAGCAAAPAIGVAVVAGQALLFTGLTGRPLELGASWGVFLFQVLLVAAPFLLLALIGTRRKSPWLVALALTLALWGYYLFDGVSYQLSGDASGANIGLGLILLASPLFIAGAALAAHAWSRRRE